MQLNFNKLPPGGSTEAAAISRWQPVWRSLELNLRIGLPMLSFWVKNKNYITKLHYIGIFPLLIMLMRGGKKKGIPRAKICCITLCHEA